MTRACGPKPLMSTEAFSRTRSPIGGRAADPPLPGVVARRVDVRALRVSGP